MAGWVRDESLKDLRLRHDAVFQPSFWTGESQHLPKICSTPSPLLGADHIWLQERSRAFSEDAEPQLVLYLNIDICSYAPITK